MNNRRSGTAGISADDCAAIQVCHLNKTFARRSDGRTIVSIECLDLVVPPGEVLFIVGPTGCGKSTLLNLLSGLESPTSGEVLIEGQKPDIHHDHLNGILGIIFQQDRLLPWRTALQNVEIGLEIAGVDKTRRAELAESWLYRLGLKGFANSYPRELSGGMRQRVAMARTFALEPQILLGDEVFSQLDKITSQKLGADFHLFAKEQEMTVILVTHQLEEAIQFGDRVVVMGKHAKILLDVSIREVKEKGDAHALCGKIEDVMRQEDTSIFRQKDK